MGFLDWIGIFACATDELPNQTNDTINIQHQHRPQAAATLTALPAAQLVETTGVRFAVVAFAFGVCFCCCLLIGRAGLSREGDQESDREQRATTAII